MKDKIFGVLQRVGRSFMLPIAILPVAGLLLGIGSSFTNETMLSAYGLTGIMGSGTILNAVFTVMSLPAMWCSTTCPLCLPWAWPSAWRKRRRRWQPWRR